MSDFKTPTIEPTAWMWRNKITGARGCYFEDPVMYMVMDHPDYEWTKLYTQAPAVVDGFVLVPVEPTHEMIRAMEREWLTGSSVDMAKREYKQMLAAAPKPPVQSNED